MQNVTHLNKINYRVAVLPTRQWRAEIWRCPGRLLDWMPPSQIMVLSSGVWWSLLLDIRCLWLHNMTSYSHLQTKVLAKFVDTACIFRYARAAVRKQSHRHVGLLWAFPPQTKLQATPNWIMKHYKSVEFLSNFRMSSPPIEKGGGQ